MERAHREYWGRLLALLTGQLRSLDLAEECLAEAYASAVRNWPERGVPDQPAGWLLTTARNRATDILRREANLARKLPLLVVPEATSSEDMSTIPDQRLRLLFTCCHPALPAEARVALTLRCVAGLSTAEVARAFLVAEPTMAARITRAKKRIAQAGIPYRVPADAELPSRLPGVLAVLYLVFTEGYAATSGDIPIRHELATEAIRLARVLVALMPDEAEPMALLALMLLQHSRRDTRFVAGRLVLLPDQDRGRWHHPEIAEAVALIHRAARRTASAGPYLLQAAIAGEHAVAPTAADTDWAAIVALYEDLERVTDSPVVRLNRAVAVAELSGPHAGLALLDGLADRLPHYHLLPAVRADLLRRLGRHRQAATEYERALAGTGNAAEQAFLRARIADTQIADTQIADTQVADTQVADAGQAALSPPEGHPGPS